MTSVEASISRKSDSKHNQIKQLINNMQLYLDTKRDDTVMVINMHLQSLSVYTDLTIFDPRTEVASQFFAYLYELMQKMDQPAAFLWNCVDILTNICRNPAARGSLINTYNFVPCLSKWVVDHLPNDKKIRLLRLLQDLTCGIEILWQMPHLSHLMTILSQWIESSSEEIITLSIGVLANLCYKNLPAIYTFNGNVNVKNVLEICSSIKGPIEIYVCKLFVILDHTNGKIPKILLTKITNLTFESIIEAYRLRDATLLRQIINFFLDVSKQHNMDFIRTTESYSSNFLTLLSILKNNESMETADGNSENRDSECMITIFEFLAYLIDNDLHSIESSFNVLIKLSLTWIQTDLISLQALSLLKAVTAKLDLNSPILGTLIGTLPGFFASLESPRNKSTPDYIEQSLMVGGILKLLKVMVAFPNLRTKILEDISTGTMVKIFGSINESDSDHTFDQFDIANIEGINLYIYGVALVIELAKFDAVWLDFQNCLMEHSRTHVALAHCLQRCPKEEKELVLGMSNLGCYPRQKVAECMSFIQMKSIEQAQKHSELNFPILTVSQVDNIDALLGKLRDSFTKKDFNSVLTSDIIELYEYKIASMGYAERIAMSNVEAASQKCTQLEHRNVQITSELNRTHQLLYHIQQCHEQVSIKNNDLKTNVQTLKTQTERTKKELKEFKNQYNIKEIDLNKCKLELEDLRKKCDKEEQQKTKLKDYIGKLEENSAKSQKHLQKKEEVIENLKSQLSSLNTKLNDMEVNISQKDGEIHQTKLELKELNKQLNEKRHIIETITKVALNSQMLES